MSWTEQHFLILEKDSDTSILVLLINTPIHGGWDKTIPDKAKPLPE